MTQKPPEFPIEISRDQYDRIAFRSCWYLAVSRGRGNHSSKREFPRVSTFAVSTFIDVACPRECSLVVFAPRIREKKNNSNGKLVIECLQPHATSRGFYERASERLSDKREREFHLGNHTHDAGAAYSIAINRRTFNETKRSIRVRARFSFLCHGGPNTPRKTATMGIYRRLFYTRARAQFDSARSPWWREIN